MNCASLNDTRYSSKLNFCSNFAYILLLLFFVDVLSLGSGQLTALNSFLSTRELLFVAIFIFSLPLLVVERKKLCRNIPLLLVLAFLCLVGVDAVYGLLVGNRLDIILSDVSGFLSFFILLPALVLLYNHQRLEFLMNVIIVVCSVWAFCSLVLSYYAFYPEVFADKLYLFFENNTLCSLTDMEGNGTRVFFHTASRYLLPAFLFSAYFFLTKNEKPLFYITVMILCVASLFFTYSRAICFGSIIAVFLFTFVYVCVCRLEVKRIIALWGIVFIGSVLLVGGIGLTQQSNPFQTMLSRIAIVDSEDSTSTPLEDTEDSVEITEVKEATPEPLSPIEAEKNSLGERESKKAELHGMIALHPIVGGGLGTAVSYGNGYVEYFYHDLLAKTGVIGLIFFLLPFLYGVSLFRVEKIRKDELYQIYLFSTFFFFMISYFNPCLNSVTGISCYVLFLVVCSLNFSEYSGSTLKRQINNKL